MTARTFEVSGLAVITIRYEDDKIEIFGVREFEEFPDGSLEIEHGNNQITRVRPTYRLYQIGLDEEDDDDE